MSANREHITATGVAVALFNFGLGLLLLVGVINIFIPQTQSVILAKTGILHFGAGVIAVSILFYTFKDSSIVEAYRKH